MSVYIIELQTDVDAGDIDSRALERLAARVLEAESVAKPAELSIVLTDDNRVQKLNRGYRGTDTPTDVLSFPQGEGEAFADPEGAARHLGDVVISLDTARRQASEHTIEITDEVAHLLVHGVLHLLGYDHERSDEERRMRDREEAILGTAHHH